MENRNQISTICLIWLFLLNTLTIAGEFQLKSEKLIVLFDSHMHMTLKPFGFDSTSIIETSRAVQTGIVIDNKVITDFRILPQKTSQQMVTTNEFGPALKGVVIGNFQEEEISIERRTEILLPENFPDVVILSAEYKNTGNTPIHVNRVYSQRLLLNRQLAEPMEDSFDLASFQGGVYDWGVDYALIWLKPGFSQSNFQGIHKLPNYSNGGGIPFIDVWGKTMGVAIAHLGKQPEWLSLPVTVRQDGRVEMAITEEPKEEFRQKEWLKPGESYKTVMTAVIFHHLDYYDGLRTYANLLRCRGIAIKETSPKSAYEPYWKSWGFKLNFTTDQILNQLPELSSMGIKTANLDGGWFDWEGDWNPLRTPGKFPNGEKDMIDFVDKVHKAGFRTAIWWYPNAVNPKSRLAQENPGLLIQAKDGTYPNDEENGNYQLCPAYEPALEYIERLVERFVNKWGFDGVYCDKMGLSASVPCYNKAHNHMSPLESFQAMPELFRVIEKSLKKYHNDPFYEVCICAAPHSPYNMPFYDIANASDPINPIQMRRRIKVEKALHGPKFNVGDCYQVPIDEWGGSSVPQSFESAIGTGAQLTTYYTDLDSTQLKIWKRWFHQYNDLRLSSGEYLNFYDIAFDKPETHVIRKGSDLYFGFFFNHWPKSEKLEFRGLDKYQQYEVYDYGNERHLGLINGADPYLNVGFKGSLLVRVSPVE